MTEAIVDYKIVYDNDPDRFERTIKKLLTEGWLIHGCVVHGYYDDSDGRLPHHRQAMVRYAQTKPQ